MIRSYPYFEYIAAKFYFEDVKLNQLLEYGTLSGNLNFHELWDSLPLSRKNFYLKLAKESNYSHNKLNGFFDIASNNNYNSKI